MPDEITETKPNPAEAFQKLLERNNNDGVKLASQLFDENYTFRTTIRELTGKQPKEGAIVLSPEDAKKWNAYQELGHEPKEIKKSLERLPELEKTNKKLSNTETVFKLSDIGLDGSKLKRNILQEQVFDKFPDAVWRFETEKDADGNEAEVAYIKPDAEGKESSFSEFAKEKLADYLPALKVSQQAQQPPKPGATHDPKPSGGNSGTVFDRIREKVKSAAKPEQRSIDEAFGRPA